MTNGAGFLFENSYSLLPERFYARLNPTIVAAPSLVLLNDVLARRLKLRPEHLCSPEGIEVLAGNRIPEGAKPLAIAYAGHQFGSWVPELGDGRAILLGEVVDMDGVRCDVHMKGTGRTPFSRSGDGRAVLGPVIREYIVSESMAAMGIPTTRALAAVKTGDVVMRDSPLPGAVLIRIAKSHVRVGTFQYFAARNDVEALKVLSDYVITRHYPELTTEQFPYINLLDEIASRQATLIAKWMLVGFIHGVMNTDNTSVVGETIDYGPCAFMDSYHPETVYSSIDHTGRYAYCNQPLIAHWNLACLAKALMPIYEEEGNIAIPKGRDIIDSFPDRYQAAYMA